jgi:hypothetical protein
LLAKADLPEPPNDVEVPMSDIVEIPADLIPEVRVALQCMLGDGTEAISRALTFPERELHPEWFVQGRHEIEHTFELLDEIGWDGSLRPQATSIDPNTHGATLREALERYLPLVENWLAESDLNDRLRAERGEPPTGEELAARVQGLRAFIELVGKRLRT